MDDTRTMIYHLILDTVWEVCGVRIESETENLLDRKFGIYPADFLYIFDLLEKKLQVPAVDVLKDSEYTVMEAGRLSDALWKLYKNQ